MKINYVPRGIWSVAVDNAFEFEPIPPAAWKKNKNKTKNSKSKRKDRATRRDEQHSHSSKAKQNEASPKKGKKDRIWLFLWSRACDIGNQPNWNSLQILPAAWSKPDLTTNGEAKRQNGEKKIEKRK